MDGNFLLELTKSINDDEEDRKTEFYFFTFIYIFAFGCLLFILIGCANLICCAFWDPLTLHEMWNLLCGRKFLCSYFWVVFECWKSFSLLRVILWKFCLQRIVDCETLRNMKLNCRLEINFVNELLLVCLLVTDISLMEHVKAFFPTIESIFWILLLKQFYELNKIDLRTKRSF